MGRSATVSTDSVDALLEAWLAQRKVIALVRDLCFEHNEREPSDLAAYVLIATAGA